MTTIALKSDEIRTYAPTLEFRAVDGTENLRFIEGIAVPYGVESDVGYYMEQIQRGCFAKSIKEAAKTLPLLTWHDSRSFPIGKSVEWTELDDGLRAVWELDTDDETAMTAARKARDGFMTGLSVGFHPIKSERVVDEELGILHVKRVEARLLEVSVTPTPAYAGAQVALVRSREARGGRRRQSAELDAWRRYLQSVTRG